MPTAIINPLGAPFDFISEGSDFDHGSLLDLTADDHTQYALLAGRAGGQNLRGGTASGDDLTLESTSNATKGNIFVASDSTVELWHTDATFVATKTLILADNTYTLDNDNIGIRAYSFIATINNSDTAGLSAINLFRNVATIQNTAGVGTNAGIITSFNASPTVRANTDTGITAIIQGGAANPTYSVINAGTLVVSSSDGWVSSGIVNTGATVTLARHFRVSDYAGAGVVTEQVGLDIASLAKATTNISVRSAGTATEMRHAGPVVLGVNAAPTNASVGLELTNTTKALLLSKLTTTQRDALAPLNGMLIYNTTTQTFQGRANAVWVNL